ncbi:hypothetical protein D3C84_1047780 [compost metagenome]
MRRLGDIGGSARQLAVGLVARPQRFEQGRGQLAAGELAGGVDGLDIGHLADLGQVGLARQREHFGDHGLIQAVVLQHAAQRRDQALIQHQRLAALMLADQLLQDLHRQLLAGFPAIKPI